MEKKIDKLLDIIDSEEFSDHLNSQENLQYVIKYIRKHDAVKKLVFLCLNSDKAANLVLNRVRAVLDMPFEQEYEFPADSALAALLMVLVDANHSEAKTIATNIISHDAGMWWAGILATHYILSCALKAA